MVDFAEVNYLLVVIAGLAIMILGAIWYSPPVFGNIWMKYAGVSKGDIDKVKPKMPLYYLGGFVTALVTAFVLFHFVEFVNAVTVSDALQLAFWLWLGFSATQTLGGVLWEMKKMPWFWINALYNLVALGLASTILTLWR
ncbi:hypothetical protein COV82_04140 [Candidatus Peregrinibacteria bacterium CG11_big_fil_rev_8_21_14_0_20_46_8]|nr:MAG: hypothetical protein COV82_04140 [Candidatus Peregrinibacteria bacterium CG11_big_fil_rev_8_21_14_0_20_46_8]